MTPPQTEELLEQILLLIQRLERISADSIWARRSSGHRGALLKWADHLESKRLDEKFDLNPTELNSLLQLIQTGYKLLEKAAHERLR